MLNDIAVRLSQLQLFHPSQVEPAGYEKRLRRPAAARTYGIIFTPRSGSSRLTDIASEWPVLGQPNECFNPGFIEEMARKLNVRQVFLTDARFLRLAAPDRLIGLARLEARRAGHLPRYPGPVDAGAPVA